MISFHLPGVLKLKESRNEAHANVSLNSENSRVKCERVKKKKGTEVEHG